MPDQKHVTPTFVNTVTINGFLNGVINVAFSTAHWFPQDGKVAVAEEITADLRMDLACAQALRDALTRIIDENTKPKVTN